MRLPVTLHLKRSRRLGAALVLAHAAAAFAVVASTAASPLARWVGVAAIAISLALSLRRHVLASPFAALTPQADGGLTAMRADGAAALLRVDAESVVFPWLVVLRLRGDRRYALVLAPDALAAGEHRQLRLWLRWKAAPA